MARSLQRLCLVLLSAAAFAQAPLAAPPQKPPTEPPVTTLKLQTRIVQLSAVVEDKNGAPQTGLTRDDFTLKQDGQEMPIRYFSLGSDLPLTVALMVDTSGSQRTFIKDETLASDIFFQTMLGRKQDRALLVKFDSHVLQLSALTGSAAQLHRGLLNLDANEATAGATLLNDTVFVVAKTILANEGGRKAMVILTDGQDNGSRQSETAAIEQAQRANVQIYSILYTAWDRHDEIQLQMGLSGNHPGGSDPGLEALHRLSGATGGRVFRVSQSLSLRQIYTQIADDLRLQYELGYIPPADTKPNSYHKLVLKVNNKQLTVRARHAFFAPP